MAWRVDARDVYVVWDIRLNVTCCAGQLLWRVSGGGCRIVCREAPRLPLSPCVVARMRMDWMSRAGRPLPADGNWTWMVKRMKGGVACGGYARLFVWVEFSHFSGPWLLDQVSILGVFIPRMEYMLIFRAKVLVRVTWATIKHNHWPVRKMSPWKLPTLLWVFLDADIPH